MMTLKQCRAIYHIYIKSKGVFDIAHVSSPLDRSRRFTLHPLADLFIPTPTRLRWEAYSSHASITREVYSLISPQPSIVSYAFIQLSELGRR